MTVYWLLHQRLHSYILFVVEVGAIVYENVRILASVVSVAILAVQIGSEGFFSYAVNVERLDYAIVELKPVLVAVPLADEGVVMPSISETHMNYSSFEFVLVVVVRHLVQHRRVLALLLVQVLLGVRT